MAAASVDSVQALLSCIRSLNRLACLPAAGGLFSTFGPLADTLEQLGWRRGGDMTAHVYDFRRVGLAALCAALSPPAAFDSRTA